MTRNKAPLRIQKSYDTYSVKTGSAGFVLLYKNGERIAPKNWQMTFNKRPARPVSKKEEA